ncbi:hypothetical protein GKE82_24655 [Conexibacter sp. W3-3-2]|uniref:hypothetical protein n=1 Tax=Conexibacter sp. W3-3-2 TaxID=2675227 RepID=UPI0012B91557|nr:hypothetical protein [Conexibacter sp. W3-3-2]MTD47132.1 hypothetical protein [Conexibacter sp. W3-3-2]MTD47399.1 hypothetical protein [Conexibacter sp. W3-3-2]
MSAFVNPAEDLARLRDQQQQAVEAARTHLHQEQERLLALQREVAELADALPAQERTLEQLESFLQIVSAAPAPDADGDEPGHTTDPDGEDDGTAPAGEQEADANEPPLVTNVVARRRSTEAARDLPAEDLTLYDGTVVRAAGRRRELLEHLDQGPVMRSTLGVVMSVRKPYLNKLLDEVERLGLAARVDNGAVVVAPLDERLPGDYATNNGKRRPSDRLLAIWQAAGRDCSHLLKIPATTASDSTHAAA